MHVAMYLIKNPKILRYKLYLFSFVETTRKFIANYFVSTKLNKYIVFTMQTYKELIRYRLILFVTRQEKSSEISHQN